MKILLTLVATILGLSAHAAPVDGCAHKIIYLQELPLNAEDANEVRSAQSQFLIARYLDNLPVMPIFSERAKADLTTEEIRMKMGDKTLAQYRQVFAKGFPGAFEDYTDEQKSVLAENGADVMSLALNKVPSIRKIENGDKAHDQEELDTLALTQITSYFADNPTQKYVVLISSSPAMISAREDLFPVECMVTPPDLDAFFNAIPLVQN